MKKILLCTVGGSHQPIVTAITEVAPDYVCFFCTGKDAATGTEGSLQQVTGNGTPVKVTIKGEIVERLPNIPTQTHLGSESFEVQTVPPDDLDEAFSVMHNAIRRLRQERPGAQLIADYTGGTKSMSAALVMVALETDDVELRFVSGARGDLVKVLDGTQGSTLASADAIRLQRAMAPYLSAWQWYGYGVAYQGIKRLPRPRDRKLQAEWQIARDLSEAFDAWDRFDHHTAQTKIDVYKSRIGANLGSQITFLHILARDKSDPMRGIACLWDLWFNAQRRAAQGRYDDAVARVYRLLEWTAQWLLKQKGIDTGDLKLAQIPLGVSATTPRDGKWQVGLYGAWDLVAHHIEGVAAEFARSQSGAMRDHISKRNYSILAHGENPVDQGVWRVFAEWLSENLLPVLREEGKRVGFRLEPQQLPRTPVWHENRLVVSKIDVAQ